MTGSRGTYYEIPVAPARSLCWQPNSVAGCGSDDFVTGDRNGIAQPATEMIAYSVPG